MNDPVRRGWTVVVLALSTSAACAGARPEPAATPPPRTATAADVAFMSGMIRHHAQAVLIAGWAPSHEASATLQRLCERIVVGQQDEIALMRRWLEDRGEPVPELDSGPHAMPEGSAPPLMPGMLTQAQLAELDHVRGPAFDRLFLTLMIEHHRGALTMVDRLFASRGAAQDEAVFRIAADVHADQSTEIHRMQLMLATLHPEGQNP